MATTTGSRKAARFTESVIREMTRLAQQHGAVNLSQGFPDFAAPAALKAAAQEAIAADINQYAVTWGAKPLRAAVAREFTRRHGVGVDAETQVTVCCGSTEAMMSTLLATVDPGDEVVVFEPFYENYGPDTILSGATPRYVTLQAPDWTFDPDALASAFNARTRAVIINTPNNPTGKVFSREELETIAGCAAAGTSWRSRTRSTSTSSTTAPGTCRWRPSTGWRIGPSPSTACPRPTA